VVGIGASAGGLSALKRFFAAIPPDNGIAWVVVVHLASEHESHLAELLQPHAAMPVMQVTETVLLERDHVYVIPPDRNLSAVDSHLRLSPLEEKGSHRAPIDHFLRTLASSFDGHSVAVILTGTGSDGALGIRRIREKGGIVMIQDPDEAELRPQQRLQLHTAPQSVAHRFRRSQGVRTRFRHCKRLA
jgi:two-component system CheB/CheR fusion protein